MFDDLIRDNLTYIDTDTVTQKSKPSNKKYSDINYDTMTKEELLTNCKFLATIADSRKQLADNYKYLYFKEAEELDILRHQIGKED